MTLATLLSYSRRFLDHVMVPGHPERPERLAAILERLERSSVAGGLLRHEPQPASLAAVTANHDPEHVDLIRRLSGASRPVPVSPDTWVGAATWEAALLASGGALDAVDAVMAGRAANAFCLHRPPGHHAEWSQAMGFCFLNHVAIAARHLRSHHGLHRVAVIDWDVHHGNGTQSSFYGDGSVFFFSIHQSPLYPFTGLEAETGEGPGVGATLNVPLSAGATDEVYAAVFRDRLRPALERFRPEFLLLSAGFDAHRDDPLGQMRLTEGGFQTLTGIVASMARDLCAGRLVSLLEGGYDLQATAACAEAHLAALSAA